MTVGSRLKLLRDNAMLNQGSFADSLGLKQGSLSDIERGKAYPSVDVLIKIKSIYNVNLDWLISGKGDMFISSIPSIKSIDTPGRQVGKLVEYLADERIALRNLETVRIPVVGEIAAGKPIEILDIDPLDYLTLDKNLCPYPTDFVCFRIHGDSMSPELRHGDIVLINQRYNWNEINQQIVAVRINGDVTIKVIHSDEVTRTSILYPINNRRHKSIVLNEDTVDEVSIIGVLVISVHKYI